MLLDAEILSDLQSKVDSTRKQLEVYEGMLAYLKDKSNIDTNVNNNVNVAQINYDEPISLDDLNVPTKASAPTFKDVIRKIVRLMGDQEFTVAHVLAALAKRGIAVKGKQPSSRVSKALSELQQDKMVEKTYKAPGNVAHRFKYKRDYDEL